MNRGRMQALLNSGFDVADAYKLEAILSNDDAGLERTKADQKFVSECHQQILERVKDK
jgi:hypothetical protein